MNKLNKPPLQAIHVNHFNIFTFLLLVFSSVLHADAIDISGGHLGGVPLDQPRPSESD